MSPGRASRLLFGSCNNQDYDQPLWNHVLKRNGTAFVWGGDAIYADRNTGLDYSTFPPNPHIQQATPQVLESVYKQQLANDNYRKVRDSMFVIGTIDDHDYGADNGDIEYQYKVESAVLYVEQFLGQPKESIMAKRARRGDGVFGVKLFDFSRPIGEELLSDQDAALEPEVPVHDEQKYTDNSVAVFLLDVRSHKTPWVKSGMKKYFQNFDGDFLGEHQWEWLKSALSRSNASVNVFISGLQVHGDKYCDGNLGESWGRFPAAQNRLYNLILQSGAKAPILISGDVHQAELSRKDCYAASTQQMRPILEMTTSGLTHSWGSRFCSRPVSLAIKWA